MINKTDSNSQYSSSVPRCWNVIQGRINVVWSLWGVVANILDYAFLVIKFEFQSHYCIHFQTNIHGKGMVWFVFFVLMAYQPL